MLTLPHALSDFGEERAPKVIYKQPKRRPNCVKNGVPAQLSQDATESNPTHSYILIGFLWQLNYLHELMDLRYYRYLLGPSSGCGLSEVIHVSHRWGATDLSRGRHGLKNKGYSTDLRQAFGYAYNGSRVRGGKHDYFHKSFHSSAERELGAREFLLEQAGPA